MSNVVMASSSCFRRNNRARCTRVFTTGTLRPRSSAISGFDRLYEALRARVQVDHVEMVDGDVWFYTTGEVTGLLPLVGRVTVLSWQREPEVARRQGEVWRLVGFQD